MQNETTELPALATGSETGQEVCHLVPGEKCDLCEAIGARQNIEAQDGLNDTYEGDPYPHCGKEQRP